MWKGISNLGYTLKLHRYSDFYISLLPFGRHQGVIMKYLSMNEKFFIPGFIHLLRIYIKGCHLCQMHSNGKPQPRDLEHRKNNPNYKAMTRPSMDLMVMPRSHKGYKIILVVTDKETNFMVTFAIHQLKSEEIVDALIEHVFSKYGMPEYMIIDQDSAFISALINYLFTN